VLPAILTTTYPLANSLKLKLMTSSTQRQISEDGYPKYLDPENDPYTYLVAPNPPTPEAIKRAQFVDKTYRWTGK
jgi:hypothetical protein